MPRALPSAEAIVQPPALASIPGLAGALAALAADATNADREAARTNTLCGWAERDPRSAFLYLKHHGSSSAADAYFSLTLFRQWASADFAAAFDHAERHPAGSTREELLGALALIVARASPAEAAAMTELDMAPGPVRNETAISVLHQWALADIEQAIHWAGTFPPGAERERAIQEVTGLALSFPPPDAARSPH